VVPGQRVTDHLKDHEIDFVVAIEGAGIVCLEVKGLYVGLSRPHDQLVVCGDPDFIREVGGTELAQRLCCHQPKRASERGLT
jgi:hypothetical protein